MEQPNTNTMKQSNTDIHKFKYEYGSDEESPSQRYEREYKEKREKDMKLGRILTENDYIKIKNIIVDNFTERNEVEKLTEKFINSELLIVIKHVKNKHSHHMTSYYSNEKYLMIKNIAGHKYR